MGKRSVDVLDVAMLDHPAGFVIRYASDAGDRGELAVSYPVSLTALSAGSRSAIGLAAVVYLGQLSLATHLRLAFPIASGAVEAIAPLAEMLYDIRRWKDQLPPGPAPAVTAVDGDPGPPTQIKPTVRRALLLWSGGKDSTLSALTLAAQGIERKAVHFTINSGVERLERDSVGALSTRLGLDVHAVGVSHPQFLEFSTRYATNWNRPPLCNTVPFGRDMLLALLAVPVAAAKGCGYLSMGHDQECRTSYVDFHGKRVPRNDVESAEGAAILERYIDRFALSGARLLGPVAHLSELQILRRMLVDHSDLMALASFCFWGGNCGRCAKCLRYYLAQRVFGVEVLKFAVNPVGFHGAPELDDILDFSRQGTLFQNQVLYCMGRLVERGDLRDGEDRLREFAASAMYRTVLPQLPAWESELMAVRAEEPTIT